MPEIMITHSITFAAPGFYIQYIHIGLSACFCCTITNVYIFIVVEIVTGITFKGYQYIHITIFCLRFWFCKELLPQCM